MKKFFNRYGNISRLVLFTVLVVSALILSGYVNSFPKLAEYFPFVGTILVVIANWIMYRTEKKNLTALGFDLNKRNVLFLPLGLFLGMVAFLTGFYFRTFVTGENLNINEKVNIANIFKQLYWVLPTAAVQQFIVYGYGFRKVIAMSNVTIAVFVCGALFISMHNIWNGNMIGALVYAATLFIGHLMFCGAQLKSGTIYFSIGLHWGNNFTTSNLLTEGRKDTSLLFTTSPNPMNSYIQLILTVLLANIGFIILAIIIWRWRRQRSTNTQQSVLQ